MNKRIKNFIHKWLGEKVTKQHIDEEFIRHYKIAIKSIKYSILPFAVIIVYYAFNGIFLFDLLILSFFFYFISSFAPDALYMITKIIKNDKTYTPSEKRIYSHRFFGLIIYSLIIFFILDIFLTFYKSLIIAFFSFIGYWIHLTTDKVELIIDKIKKTFEETVGE